MLLEKLKLLECSLLGAGRNDREWLELVLHPDFREITWSGTIASREETISALLSEENAPAVMSSNFCLTDTGAGCAILHYNTTLPDGSRASLRSSYWLCSEAERWTLVFHQGTPVAGAGQV